MEKAGAALITGAGARIGKAMAEALGAKGWPVCIHYRNSSRGAQETQAAITQSGGRAATVQADLSDLSSRSNLVARASEAIDAPITLLINSASTFEDDTAQSFSAESWAAHFSANLEAPVHLAQQFAAQLPAGHKGLTVNLIDQRVLKLNPQFFTYTLSKTALWTATRTLAQALAPQVRVNGISPGPTLSSIHQTAETFAAEQRATLTGKGSSPEEIIKALFYLIDAESVTGQMIVADGGQHLLWQTPDLEV